MTDAAFAPVAPRLDEAVTAGDPARVAHLIKEILQDVVNRSILALPPRFSTARPDTYARRLLHRDPGGRYTAVVMTWGPGQGTALHDHAGIWCVECVVAGQMEVTQYELLSGDGGAYRFARQSRVTAERGAAGCLIPPFEYHTLANRRRDGTSITLHVYGGEMDHCHVFEPTGADTYRRVVRQLCYHE